MLLDLHLVGLDLLTFDLPRLTHFFVDRFILELHDGLDPQTGNLRKDYRYNRGTDNREVDPDKAVHLREALLVETAEAGVTLGVKSAVVLVLVAINLLEDGTRVESLTLLPGAATTGAFGVELTKLAISELEGVCTVGQRKQRSYEG